MTLTLDAPIDRFAPGQFVNLALTLDGQLDKRAYSLASEPGQLLEFYVKQVGDGAFTPALFRLSPGATILVERRPQGFFTLEYVPECREMWFIATGTGLGPFIALLRSAETWQRFERIVVVHGARYANELSYADEIAALSRKYSGRLKRIPVVSGEHAPDTIYGRVTDALRDGSLEESASLTLDGARSHVMLCGNPAMIQEMIALLGTKGLRKHRQRNPGHITAEKYW
ncbi:MAG TPA: ferredoxin--NADP reductase [Polyangiaceae bacterium]